MVSTMADYERFAQMLLNGGSLDGKTILKPETFKLMVTDQIGPKSIIDANVFISDRNWLLPYHGKTSAAQFICEDRIVNRFEQPRTERRMNTECAVHNLFGNGILSHSSRPRL